ncbi:contractile injection system tape measure protein [Chitinophaga sancti]|uniref:Contractile injection system tape measure protein n=1 Tax=Chitinophaga sancti TaxID=1004 RepID=A0A1K1LN79_9BACT|nr:contractile injection system tape measure protein [Chitinophaga sancti]WQD64994.1 contractile injection system tape measure protein [Chitinophaga sancti]WQG89382.1 contractile injection system tape measure protein [Chitinophaga sancti]SFW12349.1 hypothetical protein SAMN05661012_00067 [Chitinophaga sancti]
MAAEQHHMIRRQVLTLKLPKSAPAFEWQHEMSRYFHHHLVPLLEKACNELCEEGEVIHLDTVTIDLGILRMKDLKAGKGEELIYPLLLEQLRKQISPALRISATAGNTIRLSVGRQWLFYMQKGYLPWNTLKTDQAWYNYVLEAFATDFQLVTLLREQLLHNPVVLQRVITDHPAPFLVQLIEILTAGSQPNLLPAFYELAILHAVSKNETSTIISSSYHSISPALHHQFWQLALKMAAGKTGKGMSAPQVAAAYISQHLIEVIDLIKVANKEIISLLPVCISVIKEINPSAVSHPIEERNIINDAIAIESTDEVIPSGGIFLIHAGLVLLHPFLGSFFKKLGLINNQVFIDSVAQEKALYLLHYLATGERETPEHALVIPKLLCAWPLGKNLAHKIELSPEECAEADALLEAVIEHWDKLQRTSVDALRDSFLQRNGKLFTLNEQTFLQVEQQPLDILLDYLPWSISHIRLPWMKQILRVEWR